MKPTMKPMLAARCENFEALRYPLLASPKIDGVRAIVVKGVVLSRTLTPIPNQFVQFTFGRSIYNGMDGELIVGDARSHHAYRETTSGVMSQNGSPEVTFNVFDDFTSPWMAFHERLLGLQRRLRKSSGLRVRTVAHVEMRKPVQLLKYEQMALDEGYEGIMLRSWDGVYKFGRSTVKEGGLLKVKRFLDAEAVITGYEELEHNHNTLTTSKLGTAKRSSHKSGRVAGGKLGAITVQPTTGPSFSIGSGFTNDERVSLWKQREKLVGKIVKYQYFPTGTKERPRFPTFLGFRSKTDL